ncbi:hypothetical protein NZ47_11370 [Anaerovibrio lipolyticus]|uniref:Glycosyltransferase 2-like domain-containing protein n=1 Tax=Anaerovibrio lipolyticus TaxID=82374 RepID=A0A0B2JZC3_9FIRM|nr:glycosyltransferase family 2 protein [Anaerovibrio lipolyticus]KHM51277.1 hypothetical protein NZ47_11370 [Anaerovibrio lipolyticus]
MLSVIVPVYQAVETLERCVSSILVQDVDDIEVILVDDGSSDGSSELCDLLCDEYSNVIVKHIENSGPYQARKQGVLIAKGEVITFVDADDWLEEGAYRKILKVYNENTPDVLLFAYRLGQDGKTVFHEHKDGLYSKDKIENQILSSMMCDVKLGRRRIDPSLCCKLMKKELFLKVTSGVNERIVWGEDAAVAYPMLCAADNIYIYNKAFYHYCVTNASCTQNYPVSRITELQSFKRVLEEKISLNSKKNFRWQIDSYMRIFLDMLSVNWFGCRRTSQIYSFPFTIIKPRSRVKMFGAGEVGKSYFQTIIQTGYVELTGWYDKNATSIEDFCGERIKSLDELCLADDECILIAASNIKIADDIRADLIKRGIPSDKIIWEKPMIIC